tara:strand:- start:549 stop:914 length:366 start_codon:yes stop_codon:yes gene_type:complete
MRWTSRSERRRRRDLARARWHEKFCWWPTAVCDKTVWLETVMQRRFNGSWIRLDVESHTLSVLADEAQLGADAMEKRYADDLNAQTVFDARFHARNLLGNHLQGEKWAEWLKNCYKQSRTK